MGDVLDALLRLYDSLAEAAALAPTTFSSREADHVLDASRRSIYRIVYAFRMHPVQLPPVLDARAVGLSAERRDALLSAFVACQV